MNKPAEFFIGIDGGGTKCKARLEDAQGNLLAETVAGPANAARDLQGSILAVVEACKSAIVESKIDGLTIEKLHAGIGLAGINIPQVKHAFEAENLPFANWRVTTDLHIACLGAHQGQDGAIVIVGTGSSGVVISGDKQLEAGGHGFVVGDKGSGAWLGKMAISHCLETLDDIVSENQLATEVLNKLHCENAYEVVNQTLAAKPDFYANLAPLVLDLAANKQPDALLLVEHAASYISKLSHQLLVVNPTRLSFIGGISHALVPYLDDKLQSLIQPPLGSPEQGAIIFSKTGYNKKFY